jgi:hypothetical protein
MGVVFRIDCPIGGQVFERLARSAPSTYRRARNFRGSR